MRSPLFFSFFWKILIKAFASLAPSSKPLKNRFFQWPGPTTIERPAIAPSLGGAALAVTTLLASPLALAQAPGNPGLTELINVAASQRMLSQRIAKAYFYLGNRIRISESRRQLHGALRAFKSNLNMLQEQAQSPSVKELLAFAAFAFEEYDDLSRRPYTKENGALVLDLSETLLEVSNEVVQRLQEQTNHMGSKLIDLAGRQRMLAQRIAKYYIAYQAGFRDSNSVHQLKDAVASFEKNLKVLKQSPENSPATEQVLEKIERQWRIIRRFFLDIEKGGIPAMVMVAADRITELSDQVTKLHLQKQRQPTPMPSTKAIPSR